MPIPGLQPEHAPSGGSALIAKLETVAPLPDEDRETLAALGENAREMGARRNIIREGERPDHVHLIVEGWAARYKLLPDGARQITAFLIPGDFCDLHITILREMDHSIATLTRAKVAYIPRDRMETLSARPGIARALWWATLVDEAVLRSWIVNIGRRDAYEAIGHLMCELYVRMKNVGLTHDHSYELPLTQEEVGDALGITPVHVNRVLQRMRSEGLISFARGALTIHDYQALENASGFNPNYLHIDQRV
ncbi:MAG: Crp/Fnr family transcriptional regulator [Alphaproteobacteria bacterium]|nr:Crp/Fnr family transcriptional regulator [Alphaproteobacteria bacterium]